MVIRLHTSFVKYIFFISLIPSRNTSVFLKHGTQNSAMQCGYLREEILSPTSSNLTIDINYYLHQQILPVVSRLLEHFDGTDQAYLAHCLGLDSSKYKHRQQKNYSSKDDENHLDNNNENDDFDDELIFGEGSEAFKHCDLFSFPCVQCKTLNFWNAPLIFNEVSAFFCIQYMDRINV